MKIKLEGRGITKGKAEGEAVVTKEPISFWGGLDRDTGIIVDRNHELAGVKVTGKILVFPYGKGSTGGSRTLYASAKKGTAPATTAVCSRKRRRPGEGGSDESGAGETTACFPLT